MRVTVSNVESAIETLNTVLERPLTYGEQGHIFLQRQNGYNNIYQQEGPGASSLACGLTLREAHTWVSNVLQGIQMAKATR